MHFMDENFWVAIGFLIFLYFAYRPVRKAIINALDARINQIKQKLKETEKVRKEAKSLLDEIQTEIDGFERYKKQILKSAKKSTEILVEKQSKEMDLILSRKKQSVIKAIENKQHKIMHELKDSFINEVISLVRNYLVETNNNSVSDEEILKNFVDSKKNN